MLLIFQSPKRQTKIVIFFPFFGTFYCIFSGLPYPTIASIMCKRTYALLPTLHFGQCDTRDVG